MAPANTANAGMSFDRSRQLWAVEQSQLVERRRIHRHRRVMQHDQRMRVGVIRQCALDCLQLRGPEPALAVCRLGEPRLEQQQLPAIARAPLATHLEGRVTQLAPHLVGDVVVAGNDEDWRAKVAEQQVDGAVRFGLVVHDVAVNSTASTGKK